jgi:hypothetical protein
MADNRKYASVLPARLQDGVAVGATTANLSAIEDIYGNALTMSDFGAYGYITVDPTGTREQCVFTGISSNQLTGISTVIAKSPYTQTSGFAFAHAAGVRVIVSNTPAFYDNFTNKENDETINGTWTFSAFPEKSGSTTPTAAGQFATKEYADGLVGGSANYDQNLIPGTAGESLTVGHLIYFKESDQKWWKADADALATTENIRLGFAQSTVSADAAVNILIAGLEKNLTGLTAGAKYYVSGTAGGVTTTPAAVSRFIGWALSTTRLIFAPEELDDNIISGTSGEALSAGQWAYFKESDQKWWLTDSDAAATAVGVRVGVVQLAAAAADAVTLIRAAGVDQTQTGLTPGSKYYLGATAGAISATQGTFPRFVGVAISATRLLMVESSNVFAIEQHGQQVYGASSGGTDTYAVTLVPAPAALFNGMMLNIKADVANTGAATLNVNSLGALSIVTGISTALSTGDIVANQIFTVVYNSTGTVWQLVNTPGSLSGGSDAHALHWHDELYNTEDALESGSYFRGGLNDSLTATQNGTGTVTRRLNATRLFVTAAGDDAMLSTSTPTFDFSTVGDDADFGNDYSYAGAFSAKFTATTEQDFFFGFVAATLLEAPVNATLTTRHVAFMIEDGTIYASVADGTTQSRTDVSSGITLTDFNEFRFEFTGNGSALFYINGTLVATKATNTPVDGTTTVEFYCALTGIGANDKTCYIKHPFSLKISNFS